MIQVDFYVLPTDESAARHLFACKLAEKAWRLGHQIYIHCDNAEQMQALDLLLWQFRPESFIPHNLNSDTAIASGVLLGHSAKPQIEAELLINLSAQVPSFAQAFRRIAEVVIAEPASRQAARERFRFYREQGYALQNHQLTRV